MFLQGWFMDHLQQTSADGVYWNCRFLILVQNRTSKGGPWRLLGLLKFKNPGKATTVQFCRTEAFEKDWLTFKRSPPTLRPASEKQDTQKAQGGGGGKQRWPKRLQGSVKQSIRPASSGHPPGIGETSWDSRPGWGSHVKTAILTRDSVHIHTH